MKGRGLSDPEISVLRSRWRWLHACRGPAAWLHGARRHGPCRWGFPSRMGCPSPVRAHASNCPSLWSAAATARGSVGAMQDVFFAHFIILCSFFKSADTWCFTQGIGKKRKTELVAIQCSAGRCQKGASGDIDSAFVLRNCHGGRSGVKLIVGYDHMMDRVTHFGLFRLSFEFQDITISAVPYSSASSLHFFIQKILPLSPTGHKRFATKHKWFLEKKGK